MKKIFLILAIILITVNLYSQNKDAKNELSVSFGIVNYQCKSSFYPNSLNAILNVANYKYNFNKLISFNSKLKFSNGVKYEKAQALDGYNVYFCNSLSLFSSFRIISNDKIEFDLGVGISEAFFMNSIPAQNFSNIEYLNVKIDNGMFHIGSVLNTNLNFFLSSNAFIGISFEHEYYPNRDNTHAFTYKLNFGVKF